MWTYVFIFLVIDLSVELIGHMVNPYVTVLRNCQIFPKWLHHFTFPSAMYKGFSFSILWPTLVICLFDDSNLSRGKVLFHGDF